MIFFESVAKTKFRERSGGFLETIGVNGFFDLVIETHFDLDLDMIP